MTLEAFSALFQSNIRVKIYEPGDLEEAVETGDLSCILADAPAYEKRVIAKIEPHIFGTYKPFFEITLQSA